MSFPLLRLPLLASIEVIKKIDIKQLIILIHMSKRTKMLVKLSKVPIELTVFEYGIQFRKLAAKEMAQRWEFFDLSESPPKNLVFQPPSNLKFDTRVQWQIVAYKKVMNDFVEFFKVCSVAFELGSTCSYTSLCYMEYAEALGLKFTTARVCVGRSNGRVYRNLLRICSNFSNLTVLFETEEKFKFNGFNEYKMHKFCFVNDNSESNGFTVDNMCALINCTNVSVQNLNWSDGDFNRFLKFYMASEGKLQSLDLIEPQWPIIQQIVMDGIDNRELGDQKFEIQRVDGVKAKVACYDWRFTLNVIDA